MGKYDIGEIWWTHFPFEEINEDKHRPAIVIDETKIAVLTMMVTTKQKNNPYCIAIDDWKEAGLPQKSWARIDRIIEMDEWRMDKKIGNLSENDLNKFIQLIVEFSTYTTHDFSLVAIGDGKGRYLQIFDERWNCQLFPYFRSTESNKEHVDQCVSKLLKTNASTNYVTHTKHIKFSVSDGVYKIYHHKLYSLKLNTIPDYMSRDSFELQGKRCAWMSIEEMEKDPDIMQKNDDIVAFVKAKLENRIK